MPKFEPVTGIDRDKLDKDSRGDTEVFALALALATRWIEDNIDWKILQVVAAPSSTSGAEYWLIGEKDADRKKFMAY